MFIISASGLLDSIDILMDPCEDFFNFTCGKWMKDNIIPEDRSDFSIYTLLEETVQKQMKCIRFFFYILFCSASFVSVLLEDEEIHKSKALQLTKIHYKNCMNTSKVFYMKNKKHFKNVFTYILAKINSLKSEPLLKVLKKFGGWPLLEENWNDNRIGVTGLIGKIIRDYSGSLFVSIYVNSNWKDAKKTMLYVKQF